MWHGRARVGKNTTAMRRPQPPQRRRTVRLSVLVASVALLAETTPCRAESRAMAPAGGGLPALDVRVDLGAGVVVAGGATVPIALDRDQLPAEGDVVVEPVPIGDGRSIVHVRVPARDRDRGDMAGVAWEALFAGGRAQPLFAGVTGFTQGDPGERTGKAVQIVAHGDRRFVLVGDVREDLRLCGETVTLLDPQALYPSLELRTATVQRLDAARQASAVPIVAVDKGPRAEAPLARLLVARGSSVPDSRGAELTDGDATTAWSEDRPGMGQGEFVVMAAPRDVPIARMQIVVAPPAPDNGDAGEKSDKGDRSDREGASPKSLYLVTGGAAFVVTIPNDAWVKPGEAYEISFPKPIEASCLSLVLNDAYTRGQAHPRVTVAELTAYSEFDAPGATLNDVAAQLSGPRGIVAAQVLERAGAGALPAVEAAYGSLDARGRARAVDVAASHDKCEESAPLLARGLCEAGGEAPRKAHEKLERCKGAATVLATKLRDDPASRACVAPTLAAIAGADALEPIADALAATGVAELATRSALRAAFAQALDATPPGKLAALLGDARRPPRARLEMMRAAGPRVNEARAESDATLGEIFTGAPPMGDRYLALGPLAELARAGDGAATGRIVDRLAHDPEWPVRARAADAAAGLPDAQAAIEQATRDAEPRVREAAFQAMAGVAGGAGAIDAARAALGNDGWAFVKVQAVGVLARGGASGDIDASLARALRDRSPRVRGASLVALGRRRATATHDAVRERLEDVEEDADVRATAARVLGAMCDASSADRLTGIARLLALPGLPDDAQSMALGALEGLAALHPADLADRIAPLRAKAAPPSVRAAAEQALAARGACR
jgi:hypothetical protein